MNCINCEREARWIFAVSGIADRPYCDAHLPSLYRGTGSVQPAPDKPAPAPANEAEADDEDKVEVPKPRPRKRK